MGALNIAISLTKTWHALADLLPVPALLAAI